jgi:hypothetical protein
MIEALHKYDSILKAVANRIGIAFAATLALALAIGVNAAIFNLGELRRTVDVFPDPAEFFLRSLSRPQTHDAAIVSGAECPQDERGGLDVTDENAPACVFFQAGGGNSTLESGAYALLLGDCLITRNLYAERASATHAPGSSACE